MADTHQLPAHGPTHPRIFLHPLSHAEAVHNIDALMALPHCRMLGEQEGFWNVYRQVSGEVPTRGNPVPDAHPAAIDAHADRRRGADLGF